MKKRGLYKRGVNFRYNRAKGFGEPEGGWEGASIGYEVELLRGAYARCYIRPELGIKDVWEAREYCKLYAICESLKTAPADKVQSRLRVTVNRGILQSTANEE